MGTAHKLVATTMVERMLGFIAENKKFLQTLSHDLFYVVIR
jgi:hypothetical protein